MLPFILASSLSFAAPVAPAPPADPFVEVSCGAQHSCARTAAGLIHCWGSDRSGEVSNVPAGTFSQVSAGASRSCAINSEGAPQCWGRPLGGGGDDLELDLDIDDDIVQMPTTLASVVVGTNADCGLDPVGRVHCWGVVGELVSQVPPEGGFVSVSVGQWHACAQRKDGSLSCWGRGARRDGGGPFQAVPPAWPVTQVAVGRGEFTCGLRTDGSVACWGSDAAGDGSGRLTGQLRAPPGVFTAISAGLDHACGLREDGSVTCWGSLADP
ncbi:MAG: hypothetical protein GXP62_22160, partial [Oligoflexia bacterium]|nr:hypothetical protein [Oligoflexia bacterium]